jgi:DUF1009 family protein
MTQNHSTLGIIAGKGGLPTQLISHCKDNGRPFFVLAFEESFDAAVMASVPHAVVRLGAVGEGLAHLRGAGVCEIVMAGGIKRPSLSSLNPDAAGAKLLKKIGFAFLKGDDALLKAITAFFEEENFIVVGVEQILNNILAPAGVYGKIAPDERMMADIMLGMREAKNLGALDIGQAVIIENGKVLATENAEGTDAMILSCAKNRSDIKSGVLVKAKKPGQEEKVDLPSIGVQTIENLHKARISGVAVESGASLIIDRDELIKKADEYAIFVVGIEYE